MNSTIGTPVPTGSAAERWRRATDAPLLMLALAFLVVFLLPLYRPDLSTVSRQALRAANIAIWVAFAVDYLVRLYLSLNRRAFLRRHIPDLLALVVPVLRPLRLLRVVGVLGAGGRRAADRRVVGAVAYAVGAIALMCVVCAGLVLDAERGAPKATLTTSQDALWWAISTVTTVGYGDRVPVTGEGRAVAAALMLAGIALLGVVTASIAAWFVQRIQATDPTPSEASLHDVAGELRELRAQVAELSARLAPATAESDSGEATAG